jgi:hypothetical protein
MIFIDIQLNIKYIRYSSLYIHIAISNITMFRETDKDGKP